MREERPMGLMAQQDEESNRLVKLDDFEGEIEEVWQKAKGLKVRDKHGDEVGSVEDVFIYQEAQAVHLIEVTGHERRFLLPVDAVTNATEDGVDVEQGKETIMASPEHDPDDVPDPETSRKAYEHFGYPDQLALG